MFAWRASVSSAVMEAVVGVTRSSTGAPGVTVTFWVPHTKPKQAATMWVPARDGV